MEIGPGVIADPEATAGMYRHMLAAAVEKSPDLVGLADRDGRLLYVNQALREALNFSQEELIGLPFSVILSKNNSPELLQEIGARTFEPGGWKGECLVPRKDGTDATVLLSSNTIRDEDGNVVGAIGIAQDITERKRVEAESRLLAERLSLATTVAKVGVWDLDLASSTFTWDTTTCEIFGFPPMIPVPYEKWSAAVFPEDLPAAEAALRKSIDEKGQGSSEFRITSADGSVRNVSVVGRAVLDGHANVIRAVGTAQDVTERRRIEESLSFKTALLEAQAETTLDGILVVDEANRIVLANRRFGTDFGIPDGVLSAGDDLIVRKLVMDKVEDPEAFREKVNYLNGRRDEKSRDELRLKNGSVFDRYSAPLVDSQDRYRGRIWYFHDITARTRAEAESRLQSAALNAAANAILITDVRGAIQWVNPAFTRLTGYPLEEATGRNPRMLKSDQQDESFYRNLWNTILAGQIWTGEITNRNKDGQLYIEEMTIAPVRSPTGEITNFVAVKQDLTERKRAEQALRAGEEWTRLLLDSTAEAIYGIDLQGICTFYNAACARLLGYDDPSMLLGKNMHQLIHYKRSDGTPYPLEECRHYQALREGSGTHADDEVLWRKDGTSFPAEYWSHPIRRESQVVGAVEAFLDITERKRTERQLEESENKHRVLFEDSADAHMLADENGFVHCNAAFLRMFGYSAEAETVGLSPADISPPNQPDGGPSQAAIDQNIAATFLNGKNRFEWLHRRRNGEVFPAEVCLTALTLHGRPALLGTVLDITERKRAEQASQLKTTLLEAQAEASIDGILAVDEDDKIILYNQQLAKMWGVPLEILRAGDNRQFLQIVSNQTKDPQQYLGRVEYLYRHHLEKSRDELRLNDGKVFDRYSAPLVDSAGSYRGRIWYYRDITELTQSTEKLRASEEQFRQLADNIHEVFFVATPDPLQIQYLSPAYEEIWGRPRQEAYDRPTAWIEAVHPEDREAVGRFFEQSAQGLQGEMAYRVVRTDDSVRWISSRSFPVRDAKGKLVRIVGFAEDVTDRTVAHEKLSVAVEELKEQTEDAAKLAELVDILQSCQNAEEAFKIIGSSLQAMLPSTAGALYVTSPSRDVVEMVAGWGHGLATEPAFRPDDCWALRRGKVHRVKDAQSPLRCAHVGPSLTNGYVCVPLAAQGETLGVLYVESLPEAAASAVESGRDPGGILERQATAVGQRISLALSNLRLREVLRGQSIRDPLTGLYNRRFMEESLQRELRRAIRGKQQLALLMLDIDHFKSFNDTFGHQAGDALLRSLGNLLKESTRGQDVACRYGGEEFAFVLAGAPQDAAWKRAELLREEIKQLNVRYGGQLLGAVTLSIGIAVFPENGDSAESLIKAADDALYRAKEQGRDRIIAA